MKNVLESIVRTAARVPGAVVGEAAKLVRVARGGHDQDVEALKQEIQDGVRAQAQESIETVKVAEEIREHTVTAEKA